VGVLPLGLAARRVAAARLAGVKTRVAGALRPALVGLMRGALPVGLRVLLVSVVVLRLAEQLERLGLGLPALGWRLQVFGAFARRWGPSRP
jgi:hypothetical protein